MAPRRARRPRASRPPAPAPRRCSSGRAGRCPPSWPSTSPISPSGLVWMTQCAVSSNATTPNSSRAVSAAAARRIASLPMSILRTPWSCAAAAHPAVERVAVAGVHRARLVDDDDERDVRLASGGCGRPCRPGASPRSASSCSRPRRTPAARRPSPGRARGRGRTTWSAAELRVGEAQPRDVDDDDAVVVQRGPRGRSGSASGIDRVDELALGLERVDELGRDGLVAGAGRAIRGSPLTIVFESARSFWLNVSPAGLDDDPEACRSRPRSA